MLTTITLKGITDDVYERLKLSANANRSSLNSEVVGCSACDCEFVALAGFLDVKLFTANVKLLRASPKRGVMLFQ